MAHGTDWPLLDSFWKAAVGAWLRSCVIVELRSCVIVELRAISWEISNASQQ